MSDTFSKWLNEQVGEATDTLVESAPIQEPYPVVDYRKKEVAFSRTLAVLDTFRWVRAHLEFTDEVEAIAESHENEVGLTPRDWQDAIDVQDACNLSGVVASFARVTDRIWVEARAAGEGTDWVNTHPIAVLYADKITDLSGGGQTGRFLTAFDKAEISSKVEVPANG